MVVLAAAVEVATTLKCDGEHGEHGDN